MNVIFDCLSLARFHMDAQAVTILLNYGAIPTLPFVTNTYTNPLPSDQKYLLDLYQFYQENKIC